MSDTTESSVDLGKRILMTQQAIADATGYSQQAVSLIINGDRVPSPEKAIELEKATGVCREAWLWPERHFNPYMPFSDAQMCLTCPNRINRMQKTTGTFLAWLAAAESDEEKREVLRSFAPITHANHGFNEHQTVTLRKITDKGAEMISHAGTFALPHLVTDKMLKWTMGKIRSGETIHIPYFPHDLPLEAEQERIVGEGVGLRGILCVSSDRHCVTIASLSGKLMEWTPKIIERWEWFIVELSKKAPR